MKPTMTRRLSFGLFAVALASCESPTPETSSSSHWIECKTKSDCASAPEAVACSQGYCVDSNGQRVSPGVSTATGGSGGRDVAMGGSTSTGGTSTGATSTGGTSTSPLDSGTSSDGGPKSTDAGSVPICGSVDFSRTVAFRLEPPSGVAAPTGLVDLSGSLAAVALSSEPCASCDSGTKPALRLTLTTTAGPVWSLVVVPEGAVDQWRASADAIVGGSVSLRARYGRGFQFGASSGFVLSDAAGIVMAAEAGPWVGTLQSGDLPLFEVTLGTDICRTLSTCGSQMMSELVFHGDTSVSVGRSKDGEFVLRGHSYSARNSGGGYLIPDGCSDAEHVSTWAIWRKAP